MADEGKQAKGDNQDLNVSGGTDGWAPAEEACFPDLKLGEAWGESITKERANELEAMLQEWEVDKGHSERKGPFVGERLTGADVLWLATRALASLGGNIGAAKGRLLTGSWHSEHKRHSLNLSVPDEVYLDPDLSALNLAGADLTEAHLEQSLLLGANLRGTNFQRAHLKEASLVGAQLREANLNEADLELAYLQGANMEDAHLHATNLVSAKLDDTYLQRASLSDSTLTNASLRDAELQGATLAGAHLEGANLSEAHLEGTLLHYAHLEGVDLSHAHFDSSTFLQGAVFSDERSLPARILGVRGRRAAFGPVLLVDIRWNDVDLTGVDWSVLRRLGDEQGKRWWRSRTESEGATRANIQFTKQLRDAGLSDDADRFAYRAQVCQRGVHLLRLRFGRWLFSWLLFIIAGYGYRPLRTLFWYLAVIFGFAFLYMHFGHVGGHPFEFDEALVFSVTSFHGRGFFPGTLDLKNLVTKLAASEAVFGLFIEVSFIATFTQRYFGK